MNDIIKGIRPLDYVLAALMTGIGVFAMYVNISATPAELAKDDIVVDSQSVWVLVTWLAVTVPILWRRRSMVAVILVTALAVGGHVALFGWSVRCGSGLVLSAALAYGVGRLCSRSELVPALLGVIGVQFLVLVRDSAVGVEILPFTAGIALAAAAVGYGVRHLADRNTPQAEHRSLTRVG